MTPKELEGFQSVLIERKRELTDRVRRLREESASASPDEEGEISSVPTHPADLGTDAFEQERDLGLAERAATLVRLIDEALARMESGDYGRCERCRRPIAMERLTVLPWTPFCTACQASQEAA
jgi:RNA polymerase-binding transcription factor DksA